MSRIKEGSRIWIETKDGSIFEGIVIRHTSNFVELYNIVCKTQDSEFNTEYDYNLTFYHGEINHIYQVAKSDNSCLQQSELSSTQGNNSDRVQTIKINPSEFDRLNKMIMNFVFIDMDSKYKDAVRILKQAESVGVVGLGSTFTRFRRLNVLVMCNHEQIYIFDMKLIRNVRELEDILTAGFVTKVVYDGEALFDCLYHQHKIEIANVFDIKVYDSILSKKANEGVREKSENLADCLVKHFNFPYTLLESAINDMTFDKIWINRPISSSLKTKAAQLVAYLLPLRDHLLNKILKEYNSAINNEYEKYKNMNDAELKNYL